MLNLLTTYCTLKKLDPASACKVIFRSVNKHSDKSDGLACGLAIPCSLLMSWRKEEGSYVEQLNDAIRGHAIQIKSPCERVEGRLHCKIGW